MELIWKAKLEKAFKSEHFLLQCSNLKGLRCDLPNFYITCLESWFIILRKKKPNTIDDVLNQNLFGNFYLAKNQQSMFFTNWAQSNITNIRDIWNTPTQNWKSGHEICNQLTEKRNWIAEYSKIKALIPSNWKQILKGVEIQQEDQLLDNTKNVCLSAKGVCINGKIMAQKKVKQKELYFECLYPSVLPTCIDAWSRELQSDIDIHKISNSKHRIYNKKALDFHWKTLHRAIFNGQIRWIM